MIPVTYYPVVMQRRFAAAQEILRGTPYEKYVCERMTVPEHVAQKILSGAMVPTAEMAPTPENLNALLEHTGPEYDCGYTVLEGPTLHVRSRVSFPGATPEMFKWWFCWHALDPRRYMIWFPHSHIENKAEDPVRIADQSLTFEERFYDNRQHVTELMGPDHFESVIKFCDPSLLGFDPRKLAGAGFTASASGLLEFPGLPNVTNGMMVHIVREVSGGMELVSRYWVGTHPSLKRFPGVDDAAELFAQHGMDHDKMEMVAYELAVHDMTEWNNLARILPDVYREFSGLSD